MRIRFLACALIAALAGMSQAATAATPPTNPTNASARKPAPRGLNDAAIEQAIRAKLAKSKIGADHLSVKVQGGIAYWEGKTDVVQHKGAATRMAKTAGATAVVNNIQITENARRNSARGLSSGVPRVTVKRPSTAVPQPPK
jgi:osmotically-inducible protein OsmY